MFLLNRAPTTPLDGRTPYQAWYWKKPPVHFLKVFGCVAYIKQVRPHLTKLDDRGIKVVYIGYQDGTKAYRFFDREAVRVYVSHDAVFDEDAQWDWEDTLGADDHLPFTIEDDHEVRTRHTSVPTPAPESPVTRSQIASAAFAESSSAPSAPTTSSSTPSTTRTSPSLSTPSASTQGTRTQIEFAMPLANDVNLDTYDEGEPHRYRTLESLVQTRCRGWRTATPPKPSSMQSATL